SPNYTRSLHDALPISDAAGVDSADQRGGGDLRAGQRACRLVRVPAAGGGTAQGDEERLLDRADAVRARRSAGADDRAAEHRGGGDRKSTRLNSSHLGI